MLRFKNPENYPFLIKSFIYKMEGEEETKQEPEAEATEEPAADAPAGDAPADAEATEEA